MLKESKAQLTMLAKSLMLGALGVLLFCQLAHSRAVFEITPSITSVNLQQGASTTVDFTITNTSGVAITIDKILGQGTDIASAAVTTSNCGTLASNGSCSETLQLSTTSQTGTGQIDLYACAFNGALCSGARTKVQVP